MHSFWWLRAGYSKKGTQCQAPKSACRYLSFSEVLNNWQTPPQTTESASAPNRWNPLSWVWNKHFSFKKKILIFYSSTEQHCNSNANLLQRQHAGALGFSSLAALSNNCVHGAGWNFILTYGSSAQAPGIPRLFTKQWFRGSTTMHATVGLMHGRLLLFHRETHYRRGCCGDLLTIDSVLFISQIEIVFITMD